MKLKKHNIKENNEKNNFKINFLVTNKNPILKFPLINLEFFFICELI